jgi:hypothetical protein
MKISKWIVTATLLATATGTAAMAQQAPYNQPMPNDPMHHNDRAPDNAQRPADIRHDGYPQAGDRRDGDHRRYAGGDRGYHNGWRHHRHCRMEWHHHHQVRVCR